MGYMNEFPHTREFDSDLREILEMYETVKSLPSEWETYSTDYTSKFNQLSDKVLAEIADLKEFKYPQTVKNYGAVGDGSTNDTEAIKKAIEEETFLIFPEGQYLCNGLVISNKVIFSTNAKIVNLGSWQLENCVVIGAAFTTNANTNLCTLNGNVIIDKCSFIGGEVASIDIQKSDCAIINSRFTGSDTQFGIWSDNQSTITRNIIISNSSFNNYTLNAIYGYGAPMIISGCMFADNHLQTEPTGGGQIDITNYAVDMAASSAIISDCNITGGASNTVGIETYNSLITITGCGISVPYTGVAIQESTDAVLVGNRIEKCRYGVAIWQANGHATINGNIISDNSINDIYVAEKLTRQSLITCNKFTLTKARSLYFSDSLTGICDMNIPQGNNFNFAAKTGIGEYSFTIENNRPAILEIMSETSNTACILLLGESGVIIIADPSNMYDSIFTLANSNGEWTLTIPSENYLYGKIREVI